MMRKDLLPEIHQKRIMLLVIVLSLFIFVFLCLRYDHANFRNLVVRGLFPSDFLNLTTTLDKCPNVTTILSNETQETFSESRNVATLSNLTEGTFSKGSVSVRAPASGQMTWAKKLEPRVAICLVGGARKFGLTGPSLLDRVVNVFNNSDLFLHSPLDKNSYKLSLLKGARRIAAVRITEQKPVPVPEMLKQVLTSHGSPNGLQGLLQYFNLVEGCLSMIEEYQDKKQIQYDWIVRTRVDGYWSSPLTPNIFIPGTYVVPSGSGYGGLNDRFGAGDLNTSRAALSRLSLIPQLFHAGYQNLNSERAFKLQLVIQRIQFQEIQVPFCVLSDRWFLYPPFGWNIPVASITSRGPLSGAYCRPCRPTCKGKCASDLFVKMDHHFNWIDGNPALCNAYGGWEKGWQKVFDRVAGKEYARVRKRVGSMDLDQCIVDLEEMRSRADIWDAPSPSKICRKGFVKEQTK